MEQAGAPQRPGPQVHKADPARRRAMQVWLAVAVVAGALALLGLHVWLRRIEATVGQVDVDGYYRWLSRMLAGMALLFAAGAFALATWLRRLAAASLRDRRWPPLDYRSTSDLRIRYLTSADAFIGNLLMGSYALYGVAAGMTLWAGWLALGR